MGGGPNSEYGELTSTDGRAVFRYLSVDIDDGNKGWVPDPHRLLLGVIEMADGSFFPSGRDESITFNPASGWIWHPDFAQPSYDDRFSNVSFVGFNIYPSSTTHDFKASNLVSTNRIQDSEQSVTIKLTDMLAVKRIVAVAMLKG